MAKQSELCHHWAHQTGKMRNAGSASYSGRMLFSYRTGIANLVDTKSGMVALLYAGGFSSSTSMTQSCAQNAVKHLPNFTVFKIRPRTKADHRENHSYMVRCAAGCLDRAKTARTQGDLHRQQAKFMVLQANNYANIFGLNVRITLRDIPALAADMDRRHEQQKARAERAAALAELAKLRRRAAEAKADRKRLRTWLRGGKVRPPWTRFPMVRVIGDKVETTHGATVPLADALQAYELAKQCRRDRARGRLPSVGDFGAADVNERGTIEVSCHEIPFAYSRMAARLAGIEAPAAG